MRMMAVFEKGETLRYIGHLDLMRTVQRALRRSGLPIKYSNGFNPHIRLSFAAPLSVGVVGKRELMEVPVEDGLTPEQFQAAFNAVSPACLQVVYARCISDEFPTLMSLVAGSRYSIRMFACDSADQAAQAFDAFMALDTYTAIRRTKSGENPCDIRPFVKEGSITKTEEGYQIDLVTVTCDNGSLKPSLWLESLCAFAGCEKPHHIIYRNTILARTKEGQLLPMEEYPHA